MPSPLTPEGGTISRSFRSTFIVFSCANLQFGLPLWGAGGYFVSQKPPSPNSFSQPQLSRHCKNGKPQLPIQAYCPVFWEFLSSATDVGAVSHPVPCWHFHCA